MVMCRGVVGWMLELVYGALSIARLVSSSVSSAFMEERKGETELSCERDTERDGERRREKWRESGSLEFSSFPGFS